jgi:putative ABC transport system permease protein
MLKNYFKVAFRHLLNNKRYSLINIGGLAMGFFCFLLLNFYVSSEKNYDSNAKHVYRLLQKEADEKRVREMATIGPRVGTASKENFPEIEKVTELLVVGRLTVGNDPANRQYERITVIDSSFFDVFDLKFVEGSPETVFSQANGLLLTRSLAKKYFGNAPALHKAFFAGNSDRVIAGVIEDFPANTHLTAGLMMPVQTAASSYSWWREFVQGNWHRNAFVTYFKLKQGTDAGALEQKVTALAKKNWPNDLAFKSTFHLQPVQDIHLYANTAEGEINASRGSAFYVKIFFWIAVVVLLVACFNYTGLLNVSFMSRTREIGVRKVVGAARTQLIGQFFIESLLLTSLALLLAIGSLQVLKPVIVNLLSSAFDWSYLPTGRLIFLIVSGLIISLLSVAYPAYTISQLTPVKALKEKGGRRPGFSLQKTILTFQFVAAITLIACTFLFYRQVKYMQTKEMGFNSEGVVVIDINSRVLRNQFEAIKTEFAKLPEVKSVTVTSRVPGEWKDYPVASVLKPGQQSAEAKEMLFIGADKDFTSTYDIKIKSGMNFTGAPADSAKVLINQAAALALGFKDPVGQYIEIPSVNFSGDNSPLDVPFKAQVAGVVNDFHFEDFHQVIRPMVIGYWNNPVHSIDYYSLKVSTDNWAKTMAAFKKINDSFDPENPIEYNILNNQFKRFYESDVLRSRLLMFFTGIIILISCMGLFAITAYVLKHRTKEIGIRKVLGATITDLVQLVSKDFVVLVLIGSVIAIPLSWLIMSSWLQEFAYRLPVPWVFFAGAALITLTIAFMTVSFQTIKASLSNPVKSLRTE